jgi:putative spermidine/putrescine transport system ATP-binding protein
VNDQILGGTHVGEIAKGATVKGSVRAEQIRISTDPSDLANCDTRLQGQVSDVIFEGERLLYHVSADLEGVRDFQIYHHDPVKFDLYEIGTKVSIGWCRSDMKIFKSTQ